jgi:hypothetical protein
MHMMMCDVLLVEHARRTLEVGSRQSHMKGNTALPGTTRLIAAADNSQISACYCCTEGPTAIQQQLLTSPSAP